MAAYHQDHPVGATGMDLAVRIVQWLGRPADFVYPARW